MIDYIYILDIVEDTTVDGPGLRTSVYSAGCPHRCPGCHNPQSWDICNGKKMSLNEILSVIKSNDFDNVTFSGGDPFFQPEAFPFGHLAVPRIRRLLHRLPVSAGKGIQSGAAGHAAARL